MSVKEIVALVLIVFVILIAFLVVSAWLVGVIDQSRWEEYWEEKDE